ncbi:DUF721 domain-containing protein [Thorsellia anophelis]|uniref:DUF721 domain-containing protein n=1 Tax=Thorsellia anophelis DSM 18579 TaxID=1123402 RepID=A0A1H9ZEG5_9GAMM|nr:DciA family protein [Thorsellia anophelis]SES79458.1 hypothetical protein SAMN02583745_00532 [Thorsellia anophelis DSM 18579]
MKNPPKPLSSLLEQFSDSNKPLQSLMSQSAALKELSKALKTILPPNMRPHVRAANYREGTLILHISSAAWQMHLNYMREELISTLRQSVLPSLVSISFKINPDILTSNLQSTELSEYKLKKPIAFTLKNPRKLSLQSSEILINLSHSVSPALAKALKNLAIHGMK